MMTALRHRSVLVIDGGGFSARPLAHLLTSTRSVSAQSAGFWKTVEILKGVTKTPAGAGAGAFGPI
jgi:hypothetical protein